MTARKTISLTAKDEQFIASQLAKGSFGNASEVVRAGLHLLEQRQLNWPHSAKLAPKARPTMRTATSKPTSNAANWRRH